MLREGGSIIQHSLFDGVSPEVSGSSGFSSQILLWPFRASTDPLDMNSVTNRTASVSARESVRCLCLSNGVYICEGAEH